MYQVLILESTFSFALLRGGAGRGLLFARRGRACFLQGGAGGGSLFSAGQGGVSIPGGRVTKKGSKKC